MEIKTCEQYVLYQLEQARAERDWLRGKLEQAQDEAEELRGKLMERGERDASKVEQAIRKEGRRKLYRDGTGYRTSVDDGGKLIPFSDWCIEHVGYSSLRCGDQERVHRLLSLSSGEEYDELVNEWKAGRNDRDYERSLCQSYASAYRQGILLAKTDDEADAFDRRVADRRQLPVLRAAGRRDRARPAGRFPGCVEVAE
ncbi:MAG: hypothetical protein ACLSGS_01545 [Adlercreutzia sp.]